MTAINKRTHDLSIFKLDNSLYKTIFLTTIYLLFWFDLFFGGKGKGGWFCLRRFVDCVNNKWVFL